MPFAELRAAKSEIETAAAERREQEAAALHRAHKRAVDAIVRDAELIEDAARTLFARTEDQPSDTPGYLSRDEARQLAIVAAVVGAIRTVSP